MSCTNITSMNFLYILLAVSLFFIKSVNSESDLEVQITDQDGYVYRDLKQSLTLNCTVSYNGRLAAISWKKNGEVINPTMSSDNWSVKEMRSINRSDAGYYECVAKYKNQTEKDHVFLNVKGKPIIFKSGVNDLFTRSPVWPNVGRAENLLCFATGSKVIKFRWMKNRKQIKHGEGGFYFRPKTNGKTLLIFPVMKEHSGNYTCEASNEYGIDQYKIGVSVKESIQGKPETKAEKSNIISDVGDLSQLACTGKNVRPVDIATRWWFKGKVITDKQIENSSRLHSETSVDSSQKSVRMILIINQTSLEDAGNYTCEVIVNQDSYNDTIVLDIRSKEKRTSGDSEETTLTPAELVGLIIGVIVLIIVSFILILYFIKRRKKMKYPQVPKGSFKYGAFITYNSQDFHWVEANLLPLLEKNNIDCCIHYRNFEPGVTIQKNMVESVYNSRVVIVVMSNNYMKSKYCRAELDYAVHRALEEHGTNPLIILRIDPEMQKSKLPKELKNKTFLDFTSSVEKATWEKRLLKCIKYNDNDENENEEKIDAGEEQVCLITQEQRDDKVDENDETKKPLLV